MAGLMQQRSNSRFLALILCGVALFAQAEESALTPFQSDGCSLFPNGIPANPVLWCTCCVAHDLAYWQGGTRLDKVKADEALRRCVVAKAGSDILASLMKTGVMAGGLPQLPTPFRWGYGWKHNRTYSALTDADIQLIQSQLQIRSYAEVEAAICVQPKAKEASVAQ